MKTIKLTEGITKEWTRALRSRKFEQGTGWLEKESKYCCLGVLETILDLEIDSTYLLCNNDHSNRSCIKGLSMKMQGTLAEYNDAGKSFTWIADFIENGFKKLES